MPHRLKNRCFPIPGHAHRRSIKSTQECHPNIPLILPSAAAAAAAACILKQSRLFSNQSQSRLCLSPGGLAAYCVLRAACCFVKYFFFLALVSHTKMAINRTIFPMLAGFRTCESPSPVGSLLSTFSLGKLEIFIRAINTPSSHSGTMPCWTEEYLLKKLNYLVGSFDKLWDFLQQE